MIRRIATGAVTTVDGSVAPVDPARRRIARLRAANPAAADLAVLLSTAVRAEPELVRRARLLLPDADVGAEVDLWGSEILGSASPLAISLDPTCAEHLRADLAGPAYDRVRDRAGDLIATSHAGLHWSLRLEERINRLMVEPDPATAREAERLLYAAVGELRAHAADPAADAMPIARWLLAALGRIPRTLVATEAGVVAGLSAGTQLDRRFQPPSGQSATVDAWMPWLLATAQVETRSVPVRLPQGYLLINQPGPDAAMLELPGTEPMILEVGWHDGSQVRHERVRLHAGEQATLRMPVDQVDLETLTGDRYRLVRPTHGARSGALVRGLDFSAARAKLRPCLDRVELLESVVAAVTRDRAPVVVLTGPASAGKSVLLGAVLDRLERERYAVVQHFYGKQPTWDAPETVTTSLLAKLRRALTQPSRTGTRKALIVATNEYRDPALRQLRFPAVDAETFGQLLGDPAIGNFDVEMLRDADGPTLRRHVGGFFAERDRDDVLLLYLACHAISTAQGSIHLAAADTVLGSLEATAVPMPFVAEQMNASAAAQVIVILDCCYSSAFPGNLSVRPVRVGEEFTGGPGRIVLSASDATEYTFDGGKLVEREPQASAFTTALVAGLGSGDADLDGDGTISTDELYEFAVRRGRESTTGSRPTTPMRWNFGVDRPLVVANSVRAPTGTAWDADLAGPSGEHLRSLSSETLRAAAEAATRSGLRGIVVALDGLPATSAEELDRFLGEQFVIAGRPPDGICVIATTREGRDVRYREVFDADALVVGVDDPSMEQVCRELLDRKKNEVALAFGRPDGAPSAAELIRAAGGLPGRLAAIIDWLVDQPMGAARLADLPPSLSAGSDALWDELESQGWYPELGAIAVARPGFTMADLVAVVAADAANAAYEAAQTAPESPGTGVPDLDRTARLVEHLAGLRLVHLDGPAAAPDTVISVSHPSVSTAYTDRFGDNAAHGMHATAFPYDDPSAALPYQIANAAHHHARYGQPGWAARLARCGGYLDLRQRAAGVDALVADLAALTTLGGLSHDENDTRLIWRAVEALASAVRAEPDRFVDIVYNGLCGHGAARLAETAFRDCWRPSLRLRAVHAVDPVEPAWRHDELVTAVARWSPDRIVTASAQGVRLRTGDSVDSSGPAVYLPAPGIAVRCGDRLAVAGVTGVWVASPDPSADVPEDLEPDGADVTSLLAAEFDLAAGSALVAGLRDGTVTVYTRRPDGAMHRRRLVGHTGAVTALAQSPAGLLSASEDGTVRVWSLSDGSLLRAYQRHRAAVVALTVLDSGAVLSGDDKGRLRWWTPETCADLGVLAGHATTVTAILPVPGGAVSAGLDGGLWFWDLPATTDPAHRPLQTDGPAVLTLACDPVGSGSATVAAWSADRVLTWWSVADGTELRTIRPDLVVEPVHALLFDADRTLVVAHAGGLLAYPPPGTPSGPADDYLDALVVDADLRSAWVGTVAGMAAVDLSSGAVSTNAEPASPTVSLAFSATGRLVVVRQDGTADTGSVPAGPSAYRRVVAEDSPTGPANAWLQTRDGDLVEVAVAPLPPLAATVASAGPDTTALAASATSGERWLATGDAGGAVRLIRLADLPGVPDVTVRRTGGGPVRALRFAYSGRSLAAATADGTVRRIDLTAAHPVADVGRHRATVTGLAAVADDDASRDKRDPRAIHDRVVSCSADGTLRLWDLENGALLTVVAAPVGFRAVASTGRTVVARDDEGRLWVLEADPYHPSEIGAKDQTDAVPGRVQVFELGPDVVEVTVEASVTTSTVVELRAARLVTGSRLRRMAGAGLQLQVDDVLPQVDHDDRLAVARRLPPRRRLRVVARQRLRTTGPVDAGTLLTLRLTLYSPDWGGEEDVDLQGEFVEPAQTAR